MDENSNNTPLDSMTVQENNQGNIAGEEAIVEVEKKETKGNKGLMVIIFILLFAVIAMGTYIFIKEGYFSEKTSTNTVKEEEEKKKEETVKEPELVKFEGKYLYAEVPQGWSVKEFEDFYFEDDKKTELSEIGLLEFEGLATFKIYKENTQLFRLSHFFGGVGTLDYGTMYRFKDYSPEWEEEERETLGKVGSTFNIIDLTETPYSEYKILGATIRRVNDKFFQDQVKETTTTFECYASSPILWGLQPFPCTTPSAAIEYQFTEGITEPDLLIIDNILQSLKPNCSE